MGFDVKDLAGISDPAKKLIEVVSSGIGSLFRPRSMRNEADAKAYEIRAIAAAEADATVTKATGLVRAELERIRTMAADAEIVERAKMRLLSREIEGQMNVEAIAEHALSTLPNNVSDQPVSDDWKRKFFLGAENICDVDLQLLWGKVLAGEVVSPGSYSMRTLEILKNLTKDEAELFRKASGIAFRDGWIMKPDGDLNTALTPYGLNYNALLTLRDAGLLHEGDTLIKDFSAVAPPAVTLINNGVYMRLSGAALAQQRIPAIPFTRAGQELQNLLENNPCMPFLQSVAVYFRARGIAVKKGVPTTHGELTFEEDF